MGPQIVGNLARSLVQMLNVQGLCPDFNFLVKLFMRKLLLWPALLLVCKSM